jgi:hypothetical protein
LYRLRLAGFVGLVAGFSFDGLREGEIWLSRLLPPAKLPAAVCDLGRGRADTLCEVEIRSGDVGEECSGEATCDDVVEEVVDIVW